MIQGSVLKETEKDGKKFRFAVPFTAKKGDTKQDVSIIQNQNSKPTDETVVPANESFSSINFAKYPFNK